MVFSITVTGILANTLVNAPLPDIVAEFGVDDGAAGLIVAAGALPGIVMAPAIGLLADRFGRRVVLIPCLVVFGIAGVGAAFAPTFGFLLACRALQGLGSAGLINLAVVLLADSWEGTARARVIGQNAAVLTVSIAVLPALGGVLAEVGGWRWSFAPYGLALFTAVGVWAWVPEHVSTSPVRFGDQLRDAAAVVRRPLVAAPIAFGGMLFVLIFGLYLTVLPLLLEDRFGLGAASRGFVLAAPAVASTAVALNLARLRTRFGARRLVLASSVTFAVSAVTIGLAPSLVVLLVGALVYGLGEGASIPTLQDLVAGAAPTENRGAVVAAWVGSARLGQTIGPLLAGGAMALVGPGGAFVAGGAVAAALAVAQVTVRIDRTPAAAGGAVPAVRRDGKGAP